MKDMGLWSQLIYYFTHNGMYVLSQFNQTFLVKNGKNT